MKYKSKNMKKGVSLALTAMMVMPTTTASFAAPINGTTKDIKDESIPYNVLNQKILSNPDSPAEQAVDSMEVYTSFTGGAESSSGNGSINNPYNRFEDAVANVADGGTIYIKADGFAFLNDVGNNMPFVIDKNVTIKPVDGASNATLSVRSAGIVLGADVTFENITLSFANKYHDSIFANGHTLNLINVTRGNGTREIDLFAGGLYELGGSQVHPSGSNGVINIEVNDSFGGGNLMSNFGNIYAGSMNGEFNGSTEINVSNKSTNGSLKKLKVGAIKASGALEAKVTGDLFDFEEPLPPTANPDLYKVHGNVEVNLHKYQIEVDGSTGGDGTTSVTTSTIYPTDLKLKNINNLTVEEGHIKVVNEESNANVISSVTIGNGAILDLSKAGNEVTIDSYNGNGIVMLAKDGRLNITDSMNGSIEFQTEGAWNGESGKVNENHVYITTPNKNAVISFTPHYTQSYLDLVAKQNGSVVEWIAKEPSEEEDSTESVKIEGLIIENARKTMTYDELNDTESMSYATVKFPFEIETNRELTDDDFIYLENYEFEITVNGKQAVYREDSMDYFVEDLGLSMYFTSETSAYEHEVVVTGVDANGNPTPIQVGEYEINVSHSENAEFTSYLTVTNGEEPPVNTPEEDETPSVEEVVPDEEGWLKTTTLGQVEYLWDYTINEETNTVVLENFKGINIELEDIKVEIPKTVDGYNVALSNLNNDTFQRVTHIRVADGEGSVKVLATDLSNGFKENNTLKYVDLEGLDVSEVDDMSQLFSMCDNLRFIKVLDWEIKDTTNITAMFYARLGATDDEKKLLVVTNDAKIDEYNFKASNRIPSVVTYSGEGGHFLGDENILNMAFHRYTIGTDNMEELVDLPKHDEELAGTPSREGYKFKGWYTEDAEPTNVFELINMTYKAEWEKVEVDGTPEIPDEDFDSGMDVNPDKDQVVDDTPVTLPDDVPVEEDKPEAPQPPVEDSKPELPPVEDGGNDSDDNKPQPTPPVVTPPVSGGGGGGGAVQPPSTEDKEEDTATNGIENLKDLDKQLQEKVDSIIAEYMIDKQGLTLNILGDEEDIKHVSQLEVTKNGIFAVVDGKKLKFGVTLDGLDLDLAKARAIRVEKSRNSIMRYSAIPHQNTKDGVKISSNDLENILITSKVAEPFVDVNDKDWFKVDVEEAYNYGFTQGTSLDTYNPHGSITRGEFAVMIARALELKAQGNTDSFADVKGKWYENEVQALKDAGIVLGLADGTFGGDKTITRQEAATFITRMLTNMNVDITVENNVEFIDVHNISAFAKESVQYLASQGVLVGGGDNKFNPTNNLTRAEMAKILVRSIKMSNWY